MNQDGSIENTFHNCSNHHMVKDNTHFFGLHRKTGDSGDEKEAQPEEGNQSIIRNLKSGCLGLIQVYPEEGLVSPPKELMKPLPGTESEVHHFEHYRKTIVPDSTINAISPIKQILAGGSMVSVHPQTCDVTLVKGKKENVLYRLSYPKLANGVVEGVEAITSPLQVSQRTK